MRRIGWLLTVMLCMVLAMAGAGAEMLTLENERIADVAGGEDAAYLRTEEGTVYRYAPDSGEAAMIGAGYPSERFGGLFVYEGAVYTLEKSSARFAAIGAGGALDGQTIPDLMERAQVKETWTPYCMQSTDSGLFWLMDVDYADDALLCRYDYAVQTFSCRSIQSLHAYCVRPDGSLLIVTRGMEGRSLSSYDWDSEAITQIALLPQGANGFVVSEDALLFNVSGEVMRRAADGTIETVLHMPIACDNRLNSVLIGGDTLTAAFQSQLAVFRLSQAQGGAQTLLVLGDFAQTPGYQAFTQTHPDVEVQLSYLKKDLDTMGLAEKLLTGELDYDVFHFSSTDFDIETLARKGYLADLSGSAALTDAVGQMEPNIVKAAVYGGQLYAVPSLIHGNFPSYSDENFARAGLDNSQVLLSYDALYDFILSWDGEQLPNQDEAFCLFAIEQHNVLPYFLKELLKFSIAFQASQGESISFDSAAFRALLIKCREVAKRVEAQEMSGWVLFDLAASRIISRGIMPLTLEQGGTPVVPVMLEVYVVNPMSENKALAIAYIESCVANAPQEQRLELYTDYIEPMLTKSYEEYLTSWTQTKQELENQLAATDDPAQRKTLSETLTAHIASFDALAPEKYELSPEDIAYYKQSIAPYMFVPNARMMNLTVNDQFTFESAIDRYLDGALSDEQLIGEMDDVSRMIEMESR